MPIDIAKMNRNALFKINLSLKITLSWYCKIIERWLTGGKAFSDTSIGKDHLFTAEFWGTGLLLVILVSKSGSSRNKSLKATI